MGGGGGELTSETETHAVEQPVEHNGEHHSTKCSPCHHNTQSQTLTGVEIVSNNRKRCAEHESQTDTTEYCLCQEELVVLAAEAGQDQRYHIDD